MSNNKELFDMVALSGEDSGEGTEFTKYIDNKPGDLNKENTFDNQLKEVNEAKQLLEVSIQEIISSNYESFLIDNEVTEGELINLLEETKANFVNAYINNLEEYTENFKSSYKENDDITSHDKIVEAYQEVLDSIEPQLIPAFQEDKSEYDSNLQKEKDERERIERERLEKEKIREAKKAKEEEEKRREEADKKAEAERLEAERLEAERLEAERLEAERLEAKRLEAERLEAERLEAERLEAERLEAESNSIETKSSKNNYKVDDVKLIVTIIRSYNDKNENEKASIQNYFSESDEFIITKEIANVDKLTLDAIIELNSILKLELAERAFRLMELDNSLLVSIDNNLTLFTKKHDNEDELTSNNKIKFCRNMETTISSLSDEDIHNLIELESLLSIPYDSEK